MRSEEAMQQLLSAIEFADLALRDEHLRVKTREHLRTIKAKVEWAYAVLNDQGEK